MEERKRHIPIFRDGDRVGIYFAEQPQLAPQYVLKSTYEPGSGGVIVALTEDGKTCCGTIAQEALYKYA